MGLGEDGSEETVSLLEPNSSFGEISILCNIPQPYTVRVCELCRLLRLDKQSFTNILDIYFYDGRKILNNLLEVILFLQLLVLSRDFAIFNHDYKINIYSQIQSSIKCYLVHNIG